MWPLKLCLTVLQEPWCCVNFKLCLLCPLITVIIYSHCYHVFYQICIPVRFVCFVYCACAQKKKTLEYIIARLRPSPPIKSVFPCKKVFSLNVLYILWIWTVNTANGVYINFWSAVHLFQRVFTSVVVQLCLTEVWLSIIRGIYSILCIYCIILWTTNRYGV